MARHRKVPKPPSAYMLWLRERREQLCMNQTEVAEQMGTTQSAVSDAERGVTEPTVAFLLRYASAVNCVMEIKFHPRRRSDESQN